MVYIFTDGASRGNGGHSASAFIITDSNGNELHRSARFLGNTTNNMAEYGAVFDALEYCLNKNLCNPGSLNTIVSDSQLIVHQLDGSWRINKPELMKANALIRDLMSASGSRFKFEWVPRTHSKIMECDAMNNKILDLIERSPPGRLYEGHENDLIKFRKTSSKRKPIKRCACRKK